MRFVALDLETTGLSPQKDYILEIGACRIVDGVITDTFETLVQCPVAIAPRVVELTGITDAMAQNGMKPQEAIQCAQAFAGDDILLGHNIPFDYGFLRETARRYGYTWETSLIDTLRIARAALPDIKKRTLEYLCQYYKIETKESHRAFEDARASWEVYKKLQENFGQDPALSASFQPFVPEEKKKKTEPVTKAQIGYLQDLLKFHHLTLECPLENLTKSEASRRIDEIIREHGRIRRFR